MTDEELARVATKVLRAARLQTSTEAALQQSIERVLTVTRMPFVREISLGPKDRPDFLLGRGGVVVEAKLKYPKRAILRQLARYAEHEQVEAIVLVTGTAMGVPADVNGKPVYVVSIGAGLLGC